MSKFVDLVKLGMGIDDKPMTAEEYDQIRERYGDDLNVEDAKLYLDHVRDENRSPEQRARDEKEAKKAKKLLVGLAIGGAILYGGAKVLTTPIAEYNRIHFPDEF